jgi:hypothetical protein
MRTDAAALYSPHEIARAAGVADHELTTILGAEPPRYFPHDEAVRLGRLLVARARTAASTAPGALFASVNDDGRSRRRFVPLALSSSLHIALAVVFVVVAGLNIAPRAAVLRLDDRPDDLLRLVFLQTPGPGGGGGGGGLRERTPPPKAMREGTRRLSSPLPERQPPTHGRAPACSNKRTRKPTHTVRVKAAAQAPVQGPDWDPETARGSVRDPAAGSVADRIGRAAASNRHGSCAR